MFITWDQVHMPSHRNRWVSLAMVLAYLDPVPSLPCLPFTVGCGPRLHLHEGTHATPPALVHPLLCMFPTNVGSVCISMDSALGRI